MALRDGDIERWSCTKLRIFFEERTPKWMQDNLELSNIFALERKLNQCSAEIGSKTRYILTMVKHAIRKR